MRRPFELGCVLWRNYGQIAFSDFRNLEIQRAFYTPPSGILELEYVAGPDSVLKLDAAIPPKKVELNGKFISLTAKGSEYTLPVPIGKNSMKIQFSN